MRIFISRLSPGREVLWSFLYLLITTAARSSRGFLFVIYIFEYISYMILQT